MNTPMLATAMIDRPPAAIVSPGPDTEIDIAAAYVTFRTHFRAWTPDRQRNVIAVAWERWRSERDADLRPILADMANDLETLVWRADNAGAASSTH